MLAGPATKLVPGQSDTNTFDDIFLFDRSAVNMTLVSHASGSSTTACDSWSLRPGIRGYDAYVVFESACTNLALKGGAVWDVFLFACATGTLTVADRTASVGAMFAGVVTDFGASRTSVCATRELELPWPHNHKNGACHRPKLKGRDRDVFRKGMATMSNTRSHLVSLFLLAAPLGAVSVLQAQEQFGAIVGVVRDESGGVPPGTSVVVTNKATHRVVTLTTDGAGTYRARDLDPGLYSVRFELSGFARSEVPEVPVLVGGTLQLDAVLKVGSVAKRFKSWPRPPRWSTSAPLPWRTT